MQEHCPVRYTLIDRWMSNEKHEWSRQSAGIKYLCIYLTLPLGSTYYFITLIYNIYIVLISVCFWCIINFFFFCLYTSIRAYTARLDRPLTNDIIWCIRRIILYTLQNLQFHRLGSPECPHDNRHSLYSRCRPDDLYTHTHIIEYYSL